MDYEEELEIHTTFAEALGCEFAQGILDGESDSMDEEGILN